MAARWNFPLPLGYHAPQLALTFWRSSTGLAAMGFVNSMRVVINDNAECGAAFALCRVVVGRALARNFPPKKNPRESNARLADRLLREAFSAQGHDLQGQK